MTHDLSMEPLFRQMGLRHPIFQAPIGSLASPELAAAVSEAGGLGQLSFTWKEVDQIRSDIQRMKVLTQKCWGANFVLEFPIDEKLEVALDGGAAFISFFWGSGARYLPLVQRSGAVAAQIVGSVREAQLAAEAGFQVIVAQGFEAGGHVRGHMGTLALVPQVVDAVHPIPVIAAGGICDSRGVAAAMALGAAGVWIGTGFLAAAEANIHPDYQQRVIDAAADDTVHCDVFNIGWPDAPQRVLRNTTTDAVLGRAEQVVRQRPRESDAVAWRPDGSPIPRYHFGAPHRAVTGDVAAMALYAGQAVGLVKARRPAAQIVGDLAAGIQG